MPKRSGTSIEEKPKIKKQKQSSLSGFFISSKKSTKDESKITAAEGKASSVKPKSSFPYKIFCDLDGVLVDFEAGVKKICNGKGPDDIPNQSYMWGAIARTPLFYQNLPWTKDGKQLWNAIKHTMPDILTGVPRSKNSRLEKAIWCQRELIEDGGDLVVNHVDMAGKKKSHEVVLGRKRENVVNVITCWSVNKYLESGERQLSAPCVYLTFLFYSKNWLCMHIWLLLLLLCRYFFIHYHFRHSILFSVLPQSINGEGIMAFF
mmetsp:Transcript_10317/g.15352  ORF Transcript_10317/g.15352 Transcript_10317/m.15352 type:complete len:262 (+) Transcript_10317:243-1028(+)